MGAQKTDMGQRKHREKRHKERRNRKSLEGTDNELLRHILLSTPT